MRTYLDCHWITTQVLHQHALKVPQDTDLIVGYMFQVNSFTYSYLLQYYHLLLIPTPWSLES